MDNLNLLLTQIGWPSTSNLNDLIINSKLRLTLLNFLINKYNLKIILNYKIDL